MLLSAWASVDLLHAYLTLGLDSTLRLLAITRCILLKIAYFLYLLLCTLIRLLRRDVEVCARCSQA